MSELADYDKYDYHYEKYWEQRRYEHESEVIAIKKLLDDYKGKRIIDIGGSYGRLIATYADHFDEVVILDYSLKTLQRNKDRILSNLPKAMLIAANAYKAPFQDGTFDGEIMVRVLHHITDQTSLFDTLYRLLSCKGVSLIEVPNKIHLKNRIKALLSNNKNLFSMQPVQQESLGANEGSSGEYVPFLNYHPKYIEVKLHEAKFHVDKKLGCSYLRSTPLSRHLPLALSITTESVLQPLLFRMDLTPSIFYKLEKRETKKSNNHDSNLYKSIFNIFRCPACNTDLPDLTGLKQVSCNQCNSIFLEKEGVWDFRVE